MVFCFCFCFWFEKAVSFWNNFFSFFNFPCQSGEYFVSLKGFKIPHKSADKIAPFDLNNPPPPGTEDDEALTKLNDNYESPLATDKRPAPPTFEIPIQSVSLPPNPTNSSIPKPTKRSALFSKCFSAFLSHSCQINSFMFQFLMVLCDFVYLQWCQQRKVYPKNWSNYLNRYVVTYVRQNWIHHHQHACIMSQEIMRKKSPIG